MTVATGATACAATTNETANKNAATTANATANTAAHEAHTAAKSANRAAAPTQIGTAAKAKLGKVLVNSSGRTLYIFTKDPRGRSACSQACAGTWIPVLGRAVKAKAGSGVNQKLLGTTVRSNGFHQVTYDHHPLYTYKPDTTKSAVHGEAKIQFGGFWYTVNTKGAAVKPKNAGPCNPTCTGY